MKNTTCYAAPFASLAALSAFAALTAVAQTPSAPIMETKFAKDADGWMAFGDGATVKRVAGEGGDTDTRKGALQFDYKLAKGNISALFLQVNPDEIARAQSFKFSVKAAQSTAMVAAVQEEGGGRYLAFFQVPANKWQPVTLGISDFTLSEGKDDPKDDNGKLDVNKIQNVGLTDLGMILVQGDEGVAKLFGVSPGARSFQIGPFSVTSDTLPGASFLSKSEPRLDTFQHPQIGWIVIGGAEVTRSSGGPLSGSGLKATYKQETGKVVGLARMFPRGFLVGRDGITFRVASEKSALLIVQIEEQDGGKYNIPLTLDGKKADGTLTDREIKLAWSEFKPADDSRDPNNKLDLDRVHQILFLDVAGLVNGTGNTNTLYIGGIRAPVK